MLFKMKILAAVVLISLTAMPFTAAAHDFDKDVSALEAGDYATALKEWKSLAEQSAADAHYYLGIMSTTVKVFRKITLQARTEHNNAY
jgi:hypothetical protein